MSTAKVIFCYSFWNVSLGVQSLQRNATYFIYWTGGLRNRSTGWILAGSSNILTTGGTTRYLGRGQRDCCQIRVTDIIKFEPLGPWLELPTSPARPNWATLQKGPSTPISKFGHSRPSPLKRTCTTFSEIRHQLSLLPLLVTLRENSESEEDLPQNDTIWTRLLRISTHSLSRFSTYKNAI